MKILISFFLIPFVLFSQQDPELISQDDVLRLLNVSLFKDYALDHNTDLFEKTATDDFVLVAAVGHLETKENAIKGVKNLDLKSLQVTTDKIIINQNVGIVIGALKMDGTIMKRQISNDFRYMSVFIKNGDTWTLQSRSMTPIISTRKS